MITLEEYKSKYRGLSESEVNKLIRSDSDFRNATEALYVAYFRTPLNKKCGDCWKDAYILLLRRESSKVMEQTRRYELVAGALLRDVRNMNDDSRLVTRRNLTDELAMYHLGTNPNYIRFFSKYPENWQAESAAYVAKLDGKLTRSPAMPMLRQRQSRARNYRSRKRSPGLKRRRTPAMLKPSRRRKRQSQEPKRNSPLSQSKAGCWEQHCETTSCRANILNESGCLEMDLSSRLF